MLEVGSRASGKPENFRIFEADASKGNKRRTMYYCGLCDEILTFSERPVDPLKVRLVYGGICPGCGFELESVLLSAAYDVPGSNSLFFDAMRGKPLSWVDLSAVSQAVGGRQTQSFTPNITLGIESIDRIFGFGRLTVLTGPTGHALSLLLCVKAQLPEPLGQDSHVVWVDGGNIFDPAELSSYAADKQIGLDKVARRIRLSRAFTYHQLSTLITRALPSEMERVRAKVAVVSDMTQLYCDPDIRDKENALGTFKRDVKSLRKLAVRKRALVIVTVLRPRNRVMDSFLLSASLS